MPRPKTEYRLMQLRLSPEVHAELMAFAAATGTPATAFVKAVLTDALPAIRQLTKTAEAARQGSPDVVSALQDVLLKQMNDANQLLLELNPPVQKDVHYVLLNAQGKEVGGAINPTQEELDDFASIGYHLVLREPSK